MALNYQRVKGITIEIGADGTKFNKAIASMNQSLRGTQASLKDVNNLLKLDPKNTELLTQKQGLLKSAIDETKQKLDAEKEALAKMKASSTTGEVTKEQEALEREIIDTQQELEKLEKDYASFGSVGAQKLQAAGKAMQDFGDKITSAGKTLTTKVTAPIVGVGAAAVKTTADFDAQMSKVAAISGAEGGDFDALRQKARDMGAATKFSATESGEAMEYMAMAGWKTEDMLDGLEGIMNLAAASGEDLGLTSDIVTDGLTAFGMSAKDSGRFADVLAAASTNANTNVSMLGESFKYAAPVAGSLGYSVEDTATALGLMANAGIKASQGGTALRALMVNMAKPTKDSSAAMERLGISLQNDDGSMKSLREIMDDLRKGFGHINMPVDEFNTQMATLDKQLEDGEITQKQYDKALEELTKQAYGAEGAEKARTAAMLAGRTGMSGLLAIVNASEKDYDKLTTAIDKSGGAAKGMADKMQDNLSGQLTILKSQLEEAAISIGDVITPMVKKLTGYIQGLVDKFNQLSPKQKEQIVKIAAIVAAIGPLLVVIGTVISSVGKVVTVVGKIGPALSKIGPIIKGAPALLSKVGAAIGGISAPVLAVIAVVALLVAAFVHLWKNNEDFRKKITAIWERIKKAVSEFVKGIKERLDALGIDFKKITETIKKVWDAFCKFIAPVFEGAFESLANILETVFGVITGILDVFIGIFTGNWEQAWKGVKEIFGSIFGGIKNSFLTTTKVLTSQAKLVGNAIKKAWTTLKNNTKTIWAGIKSTVSKTATNLKNDAQKKANATAKAVQAAWNKTKTNTSAAWGTIKTAVSTGASQVKSTVDSKMKSVNSAMSNAWNNAKSTAKRTWSDMKTTISGAADKIKSTVANKFDRIKDTVKGSWSNIKSTVISAAETIKTNVKTKFSTLKRSIQDAFSKIKVNDPFGHLVNAASSAISKIKSFFNTTLKFPSIKLPKLDVEGRFSLNPPQVPRFSLRWVTWFKKAYDNPYLFTRPTIMGNRGFGDGSGSGEIVYGRDQLMRDIAQAAGGNGVTINVYAREGMNTKELARDVKNEFVRLQNQQARAWA